MGQEDINMVMISLIILLLAAFICFFKLISAPNIVVRIVSVDALGLMLVIILALIAVVMDAVYIIDIAIVYSVLMFVDILVLANYFEKRMISE